MIVRKAFFCLFITLMGIASLYAQPVLTGELLLDSVQGYVIQMHLDITNSGDQPFNHTFGSSEITFFSIDGNEVHYGELPIVIPVTIEPGEAQTFSMMSYEPLNSGPHVLQAYLNIIDNQGNAMPMGNPLTVVIGNTNAVTIGAGDALSRIPIDFYWRTTLYECIFSAEDLEHTEGWITAISFYNNFSQESFDSQQIRIYLANVIQNDLALDWIEGLDLVPVFFGTISFPVGANEIVIPLTSGFYYNGSTNLALAVHRPIPGSYQVGAEPFLAQAADPLRSRKFTSDSITLYPVNPPDPSPSQHIAYMPKTTFHIIPNPSANSDEHNVPMAIGSIVYPNPVSQSCTIKVSSEKPESASLEIFNLRGQRISSLLSTAKSTEHELLWDTRDAQGKLCAAGIYLYKIKCGQASISKRLVLQRR